MKIVKYTRPHQFWRYLEEHLPKSLYAKVEHEGYGTTFNVELKEQVDGWRKIFGGQRVATVWDDCMELYQPQYFSDFQDLIRGYEEKTGRQVELRFWEGD